MEDEFYRLTKSYSTALQKSLEANEHLRTVLTQITACREILRVELGVDRKINCPVCMERPRKRALNPCGHLLCDVCAGRIIGSGSQRDESPPKCPTCRAPVRRSMRVFL